MVSRHERSSTSKVASCTPNVPFHTPRDICDGENQNDQSMMTFEGNQFQGSGNIIQQFKKVGQVKHSVKTTDIQPSSSSNAIVIFVTGAIQIGGDNPLHFCEFFHLVGTGPGQYYVHNDVFRLNYGL